MFLILNMKLKTIQDFGGWKKYRRNILPMEVFLTGFTETEVTVKIKNSNKLNTEVRQNMKRNKKRVIPGFGLTMV